MNVVKRAIPAAQTLKEISDVQLTCSNHIDLHCTEKEYTSDGNPILQWHLQLVYNRKG